MNVNKLIVLYSDTFLWFDEKHGLFYNCESSSFFRFDVNPIILKYCARIVDYNYMYSIPIDMEDENNVFFSIWLKHIVESHIGRIEIPSRNEKQFSFPPIINLQHEIEERNMDDKNYRALNVANNFHEITFLLGGEILPLKEKEYYKQVEYPLSMESYLDADSICSFLDNNNIRYLQQINIISGNFASYHDSDILAKRLSRYNIPVTYMFDGNDVSAIKKILKYYSFKNISLHLYFNDTESFQLIENELGKSEVRYLWVFLLTKNADLKQAEKIVATYHIKDYKLVPVVDNDLGNLTFFERNVYTSYEELSRLSLSKKNIFCNQTINSNFWGKLYITPEKRIYANLNREALGAIEEDVLSLVWKEISNKASSWKCTREKVEPCKYCIYRNLCPPPSNYEFYIKRFDLCTIQ